MVQSCLLVNSQALCINIIKFCSQDFSVNKTLVITVIPCKYDRNHVLVEFSSSLGMRIMFVFA